MLRCGDTLISCCRVGKPLRRDGSSVVSERGTGIFLTFEKLKLGTRRQGGVNLRAQWSRMAELCSVKSLIRTRVSKLIVNPSGAACRAAKGRRNDCRQHHAHRSHLGHPTFIPTSSGDSHSDLTQHVASAPIDSSTACCRFRVLERTMDEHFLRDPQYRSPQLLASTCYAHR